MRYLAAQIEEDLNEKIVLLTGPRQVGKTWLSKHCLHLNKVVYLNYDIEEHRTVIQKKLWDRQADLVIFDELHKMKHWKRWIKGIFDVEGVRPRLLVTGSARMDVWGKGGDSLAGRHHLFRLHPLSLGESMRNFQISPEESLRRILDVGGYPEPFLKNNASFARRWRRSHLERVLKEDLLDLERVSDLKAIEVLVQLLSERVGSPVSMSSIARDLEVSPHTVKRWIGILESLFVIFIVRPWTAKISKAIIKEPKIYFFDTGRVRSGESNKWENLVAYHLLKYVHERQDVHGENKELHYIRDKTKREVDFILVHEHKPETLIEVKTSSEASHQLNYFAEKLGVKEAVLLPLTPPKVAMQQGITRIVDSKQWLSELI